MLVTAYLLGARSVSHRLSTVLLAPLSDVSQYIGSNPEFIALNIQFTVDVVQTSALLGLLPSFLRPCVLFLRPGLFPQNVY